MIASTSSSERCLYSSAGMTTSPRPPFSTPSRIARWNAGQHEGETEMTDTARPQERIPLTNAGRLQLQGDIERIETQAAELRELIADAHEDRSADEDERAAAFALLDDLGRAEAR